MCENIREHTHRISAAQRQPANTRSESVGNEPDVMAYMGTIFSILQLNEWRFKSYNTYTRVVEDHTDLHFNCRKGVVVWQLK